METPRQDGLLDHVRRGVHHPPPGAAGMRGTDVAMGDALGGWDVYGRATRIPLTRVLDVLRVDDALWALAVVADERVMRLVASDFAAHVHDVWDARYPDDTRPGDAIRAVRGWAAGNVTKNERIGAARSAGAAGAAEAARAAWAAGAAGSTGAAWAAGAAEAAGAAWAARSAWAAGAAGSAEATEAAWAAGAAEAAEEEWQTRYLRDVLSGRRVPGRVRIARAKGTRP
jgi:hypothetical protein